MSFVGGKSGKPAGGGFSPELLSSLSSGRNAMSMVADATEKSVTDMKKSIATGVESLVSPSSPSGLVGNLASSASMTTQPAGFGGKVPLSAASDACCAVTLEQILSWQNYSTTLMVVSAVDSLFVILWLLAVPLLSVCCIIGIGLMTIGLVASVVLDTAKIFDKPLVVVSKARLEQALPEFYNTITNTACKGRDIILWRHTATSAWSTASMVIVGYFASVVQFSILCFLAVNLLFFYRQLKSLYDAHLAVYVSMGFDILLHYWERIPKMKKEHAKLS